ncbi:hypothetical protein ACJ72_02632 [Emergomyces africanus]|uniref:Uncharacterized protein n=1 Tax=Emergomyces africanus TaxID=1955775 RepID=A0A1B7P1W1_9EURO|nr:hypothetical protein ACJ72_02632 [Emergomyces africanus]
MAIFQTRGSQFVHHATFLSILRQKNICLRHSQFIPEASLPTLQSVSGNGVPVLHRLSELGQFRSSKVLRWQINPRLVNLFKDTVRTYPEWNIVSFQVSISIDYSRSRWDPYSAESEITLTYTDSLAEMLRHDQHLLSIKFLGISKMRRELHQLQYIYAMLLDSALATEPYATLTQKAG